MSLKIEQTENGFTITRIAFQQKQKTWVCTTVSQLAIFLQGYYEDSKEKQHEKD
jgi:hypothetical protein